MRWAIKELTDDGRRTIIHADHPYMDYTLCGMALEGMGRNSNNEHEMAKQTIKKITCQLCIEHISHCKKIKL